MAATSESHHHHLDDTHHHHDDKSWMDVRARDVGLAIGIIGLGALTFAIGRATAPGAGCCDDLIRSQLQVIRLEAAVGLAGMDEAWEMGVSGQPNPVAASAYTAPVDGVWGAFGL